MIYIKILSYENRMSSSVELGQGATPLKHSHWETLPRK